MASIAGIVLASWRGRLRPARRSYRLVTRSGVPGTGILWDAWRATPSTIETRHFAPDGDVPGLIESLRALTSEAISAEDDLGQAWNDVSVLEVTVNPAHTVADGLLIHCVWVLLPPATEPA